MPIITEWRIHVGAHKTATTHLQITLETARFQIKDLGSNFLPHQAARKFFSGSPYGRWSSQMAQTMPFVRPVLLQKKTTELLKKLRREAQVTGPMAFSEEDLLGNTLCILEGKLYPNPKKMHMVAQLSRNAPLRIFLTIRSLDGYLPSAYAEALKGVPLAQSDFRDAVERFSASSLHWTSLISRLYRIAPQAQFEVWNFDDYGTNWRELHRALLGVPLTEFPDVSPPPRTRTPSEAAILIAEANRTPRGPARARQIREIYVRDIEAGKSVKFDPLSADEKAHFRKLYQEDLSVISQRFPGVLRIF